MYKVIGDSSTEVNPAFLEKYPVDIVPFKLNLDGIEYVDDSNLDVDAFVETMKASSNLPKSACPSPSDFIERFDEDCDEIYIVTISSKLSGTYNSATMAINLYEAENQNQKKIHVFDSLGAAAGETLVARMIHECKNAGMTFDEVVDHVTKYTKDMRVMFISESLDNLIKNGRISKWKGMLATTLKIHPIMGSDGEGEIKLVEKVRSANKAYLRLIELIENAMSKEEKPFFAVTHVGNPERANQIQEAIEKVGDIEVFNIKCAGLSSLYADKKGIIVAF